VSVVSWRNTLDRADISLRSRLAGRRSPGGAAQPRTAVAGADGRWDPARSGPDAPGRPAVRARRVRVAVRCGPYYFRGRRDCRRDGGRNRPGPGERPDAFDRADLPGFYVHAGGSVDPTAAQVSDQCAFVGWPASPPAGCSHAGTRTTSSVRREEPRHCQLLLAGHRKIQQAELSP
jgi:hypothetical protein